MSEGTSRNLSKSISEGVSGRDVAVGTTSSLYEEDVNNAARAARPTSGWQTTARSTYANFLVFFNYTTFFLSRLGKDLFQTAMCHFYSERVLPNHITDLMCVQQRLQAERMSTFNRYNVIINRVSSMTSTVEHSPLTVSLVSESTVTSTSSYH